MSGFEVVGLILGLYPIIEAVLHTYKSTKGGKGARTLARDLKVENVIFCEFVHHLLAPNVPEADLVRLANPDSLDATSWRSTELTVNMQNRLGLNKAQLIVEILHEINRILIYLEQQLRPTAYGNQNERGIELLRGFYAGVREFKQSLPQSDAQKNLRQLTAYNNQLQRLFADRSLPNNDTISKESIQSRRYLRQDSSYAIDLYNAICSGYQCDCDSPHYANFGLPRISDTPSENTTGLMKDLKFKLLLPLDRRAATGDIRRISICECDGNYIEDQKGTLTDLCLFGRSFDSHCHISNTRIGILKIKEKLYELHAPLSVSQNIICLDNLLQGQQCLLSRRERITLALRLSYAILQFYSTPWIESCWTWRDFCIDQQNDLELFVTRKFYSSRTNANYSKPNSEFWDICGEPILTRLGYALIELALGKRLGQLRSEGQYNSKDPDMLDYLTAKSLVESGRIMQEESRRYESVVKACLYHQFLTTSDLKVIDSRQSSFQEDVERCIIAPLHTLWTGLDE